MEKAQGRGQGARPHELSLEGRRRAVVSGVSVLTGCSEQMVVMVTSEGTLTILGEGLHVGRLNLEEGKLSVDGTIQALEYDERARGKGNALSRLFR